MKKKVALYCRIATANQLCNESIEIQVQQQSLLCYADKENLEVFKVYFDIGYKGNNLTRPGFCRMIADAEKGMFDAILVKNLNRLYRGNILCCPKFPVPVISMDAQLYKQVSHIKIR